MFLPASFRDPSGRVFEHEGQIYRAISEYGLHNYEAVKKLIASEQGITASSVVETKEVQLPCSLSPNALSQQYTKYLWHERIPFISYAYEWVFSQLKTAALLHLDLQIELFPKGIVLSDATSFNIQFDGHKAKFIDYLSFRPYQEEEPWWGYRQFCEQFLAPLLLHSYTQRPVSAFCRGQMNVLPLPLVSSYLPARSWWNSTALIHIHLHAKSIKKAAHIHHHVKDKKALPKKHYFSILQSMRRAVESIKLLDCNENIWEDYEKTHSYESQERQNKHEFIHKHVQTAKPNLLIDFGCNAGEYTLEALEAGANYAVGIDIDHGALEIAYKRAREKELNFLPLIMDLSNPSPEMGWRLKEREGFWQRAQKADMILALALIHHLAIGNNVPLDEVVSSLVACAPIGIIEFIPIEDPMIQAMLAQRSEFIFFDYTRENFEAILKQQASIIETKQVSLSGRTLYAYDRNKDR